MVSSRFLYRITPFLDCFHANLVSLSVRPIFSLYVIPQATAVCVYACEKIKCATHQLVTSVDDYFLYKITQLKY